MNQTICGTANAIADTRKSGGTPTAGMPALGTSRVWSTRSASHSGDCEAPGLPLLYCIEAGQCPACNTDPLRNRCSYVEDSEWTWEELSERGGWSVECSSCGRQLAFFRDDGN
jgi:hypothetical protein